MGEGLASPNKLNKMKKKGVMGPIISVFVLILVIAILSGLTFLFVAQLKSNIVTTTTISGTTNSEAGSITTTPYTLAKSTALSNFRNPVIISIVNATDDKMISSGNWTLNGNTLTNASEVVWSTVKINYSYNYIAETTTFNAVNNTENAGYKVVGYLPLIFLAIIFGALLTLVLRIILPYINLGNQIGNF